jgi:hypothetical protein
LTGPPGRGELEVAGRAVRGDRFMSIELTEQQQRALEAGGEVPPRFVNPRTRERFVLLREQDYLEMSGAPRPGPAVPEVPEGIRRSRAAFLRDLPALLAQPRYDRWWAAYHGDQRVGLAPTDEGLIRECLRRGLRPEDYYLGVIRPHQPDPEEVDRALHEFDDEPEGGRREDP